MSTTRPFLGPTRAVPGLIGVLSLLEKSENWSFTLSGARARKVDLLNNCKIGG